MVSAVYGFDCLGLPSHRLMPLYINVDYVKAQRLVDAKDAASPWDEDQVRSVNLAVLDGNEVEAEKRVQEWQLRRMMQESQFAPVHGE